MLNRSVAVIDVRSSDVTSVVAERGVNKTFVIKSKFSCPYDGYAEGQLLDASGFAGALRSVVKNTLSSCGDKVRALYIGVPGEFTRVAVTDNVISFPSMKKVGRSDVKSLENSSVPASRGGYRHVRSGCLYYVLSDMRRVVDPVGMLTDSLRGRLCHYLCSEPFCECVENALQQFPQITKINFIPSVHAEAMYLIAPEKRDEYAVLLDFGYISSTYSVACGNGVVYSESFSLGTGHLALYLTETMDMPYDVAVAMLGKVNLNSKEGASSMLEHSYGGKLYRFTASEIKEKLREALDGICETIEECRRAFTEKNLDYKTLYITGESALAVRGAADHISGRLVQTVSVTAPQIPYYDKPQFSSLFSLLDTALTDKENSSFLRFFKL